MDREDVIELLEDLRFPPEVVAKRMRIWRAHSAGWGTPGDLKPSAKDGTRRFNRAGYRMRPRCFAR